MPYFGQVQFEPVVVISYALLRKIRVCFPRLNSVNKRGLCKYYQTNISYLLP